MIAARQIFLGRGGKGGWVNPYVTDGLVAMWDGEWNAGGGLHDANATGWKDLVGNYDFTLNSSATINDNHIYCNGEQSAGDAGVLINVPVTSMEIVFQYINSTMNTSIFMTGGYESTYYRETICITNSNMRFGAKNHALMTKDTTHHSFSINLDDSSGFYSDGSEIGFSGDGTLDINSNRGYIGRIGGTGNVGCECRIYSIRLYSRALTAEEIATNYAVDKQRFNLP